MKPRHFLSLFDLTPAELQHLLRRASALKTLHRRGERYAPFPGKILAMIFEKASTRTRVSFEAGIAQLGGSAIFLSPQDTQLGRGEPIEDTARVLSGMVDLVMIRTFDHARVERFAAHSRVPVINGLTDYNHPCQLLADLLTFTEHRGDLRGRTVAWIGDGNNMCNSYLKAAIRCDFQLRIAVAPGYEPDAKLLEQAAGRVILLRDPLAAARDADLVATDVWSSMGKEAQQQRRARDFAGYQVTAEVMAQARPDENRLHAQKALMEFLLLGEAAPL